MDIDTITIHDIGYFKAIFDLGDKFNFLKKKKKQATKLSMDLRSSRSRISSSRGDELEPPIRITDIIVSKVTETYQSQVYIYIYI